MLCYHMGGQLDEHILLLWQPAIVFLLLCYTVCYVYLANKTLSLSPTCAVQRDHSFIHLFIHSFIHLFVKLPVCKLYTMRVIQEIPGDVASLPVLRHLDVSYNLIQTVDVCLVEQLAERLHYFNVRENPFHCDRNCTLQTSLRRAYFRLVKRLVGERRAGHKVAYNSH